MLNLDLKKRVELILCTNDNKKIKNKEEFNIASRLMHDLVCDYYESGVVIENKDFNEVMFHLRRSLFYDSDKSVLSYMEWLLNKYIEKVKKERVNHA